MDGAGLLMAGYVRADTPFVRRPQAEKEGAWQSLAGKESRALYLRKEANSRWNAWSG